MAGRYEMREKLASALVDALMRRGTKTSCDFSNGWRFTFLGQNIRVTESSDGYRCTIEGTAFYFEVPQQPYGAADAILDRAEDFLGAS